MINENIEVSNDGDNVFEKLTALSKLSVTRWTVRANFFNKVKSLNILVFKDFIFSVIYFSIILTFHFGFGNNSFLCLASISNMYRYLRVKLYFTEIQRIDFSVLYNTVYLQTTDGSSLRWVSRREFENRSTMKNYLFQMMSFKFFLRDKRKLHNLFHHRQPIENTSSASNIGSRSSKNDKVVSLNTGTNEISRKQ